MKTLKLTITIIALLSFAQVNGQQKVALQSNGTSTIFSSSSPFVDAYNAASTGDTIYLPGGNIPFPTTLDKGLTIYGAGHYPDSTMATNSTVLNGNISITANADNLHLEGIEFTGNISFGSNHKVDNVSIKRCKVASIVYNGTGATPCENNTITGNVISGGVNFGNARSSMLCNNILNGGISYGSNLGITNNIFLYRSNGYVINDLDNSSIANNIIFQNYRTDYVLVNCDLSTFSHNIFTVTPPVGNNTFEANNWYGVDITTIFENQTGNVFDYTHDYHLKNPTTYVDAVSNQIGIYGGLFPYKEGAMPANPHIKTKTISTQTNASGEINVNISVSAQDN